MDILKRSEKQDEHSLLSDLSQQELSRRKFLRFSGLVGASAVVVGGAGLTGCKKDDDSSSNGTNLGSGDVGILNYAYALEQLEAAFYTQVVANGSFTTNFSALEQEYIKDVRDHEIAHREFFKAALGSNAIQALEVDFSSIDFSNRSSVLTTAKTFEDLGVAAYNGAGKLLVSTDYLTIAGKIVSVEARHAALFRDLLSNGSFADLTSLQPLGADNAKGLDAALNPPDVLAAASSYIKTKINASNLPTS
ncbi:ferritin-like domain-containing protein [Flavisolibacter nicotianae]|uniref:ferritin-like domain-containing protein n=1 Tax=Flavisolibacter nicotianae TaxID=2364882 RepID=UPI000EB39C41|nr:ferritin-like domain-containing protein [Flavisolibacter nicotianae]